VGALVQGKRFVCIRQYDIRLPSVTDPTLKHVAECSWAREGRCGSYRFEGNGTAAAVPRSRDGLQEKKENHRNFWLSFMRLGGTEKKSVFVSSLKDKDGKFVH